MDILISIGLTTLLAWLLVWYFGTRIYRSPPAPIRPSASTIRHYRLKQNGGSHTTQEWHALCIQYDHRCAACNKKKPLTKDHIIPVSRGGNDDISNIQPLCRSCNSSKGIS